ncbi:uncharacterized protein LOC114559221 [Perca flavescens]|uniref:uncharacterized protein LOC114559221 n=1 Tax=Perca flavescens TaxID=8167 RepID=UPI00106E3E29|nr:uncharacterized protein LOC114559221 [Perca flavescens]
MLETNLTFLLFFYSLIRMAQTLLLRVIINEDDIRKIKINERPQDVEELKSRLKDELQLQYDFHIQYEDQDFDQTLCNLTNMTELSNKATLKIIPMVTLNLTSITSPVSTSVSGSETDTLSPPESHFNHARQQWPQIFPIPNFSVDVNHKLRQADLDYLNNGTRLVPSRDVKHDILEKISEAIYSFKAYPTDEQFTDVAKALISKHPSLTEPGTQTCWYGWKSSLKFKMGNLRTKLRRAGLEEIAINGSKRSKVNPGGDHPSKNIKRPKRGEANYLPNMPKGKTEANLETIRNNLVEELKKKKPNGIMILQIMDQTFPMQRREIVRDEPDVRSLVDRWPALFTKGQVCAEFNRVASKNLEGDFFEALDQLIPRSLQLFKDRKGAIGQKLTELMQDINFVHTVTDGAIASVTVGVLTVLGEMDGEPLPGPSSLELQPRSHAIILEGSIVMDNIPDLPLAVCLLFGLTYALHLDYPKCMSNTLRFIQSAMLGLGSKTLPPKLLSLKNDLLR